MPELNRQMNHLLHQNNQHETEKYSEESHLDVEFHPAHSSCFKSSRY